MVADGLAPPLEAGNIEIEDEEIFKGDGGACRSGQ
jgi:hypothetical protein